MPTTHRRRAAVLGPAFIAAAVVLGPVGHQQALAAAPSQTHAGATVKVPQSDRDYQRGFKDGFKSGFRQGQRGCDRNHFDERQAAGFHQVKKDDERDYQRGFKDGFKSGFKQGQRGC
ncbi:hypothetical protein ACF061_35360 [Streptomyces sp. NPDC015220]|uniref:hypothetical protein n=1 Tax=Streptomyces sp. NPDC015220 TaxID=3364947 RepID=UPI00370297FB